MYDGKGPSMDILREQMLALKQQDITTNKPLQQASHTFLPVPKDKWQTRVQCIHVPRRGLDDPEYMGHLLELAAQFIAKFAHRNARNVAAIPMKGRARTFHLAYSAGDTQET